MTERDDLIKETIKATLEEVGKRSPPDLARQFHEEVNAILFPKDANGKLLASRGRSMNTLRALQEKYVALGADLADLDMNPPGGVTHGNTIRDWTPPA